MSEKILLAFLVPLAADLEAAIDAADSNLDDAERHVTEENVYIGPGADDYFPAIAAFANRDKPECWERRTTTGGAKALDGLRVVLDRLNIQIAELRGGEQE